MEWKKIKRTDEMRFKLGWNKSLDDMDWHEMIIDEEINEDTMEERRDRAVIRRNQQAESNDIEKVFTPLAAECGDNVNEGCQSHADETEVEITGDTRVCTRVTSSEFLSDTPKKFVAENGKGLYLASSSDHLEDKSKN